MLGKKPTTRTGLLALLALLAFGPGVLAAADEASEAEQTPEVAQDTLAAAPVHGALGMIVVLDEETGKLRAPTSYEMDDMTSQHEQYWLDGSDLETTRGPGDSVILKLDSRFHKFAVVEVPEAGQASVQHDVVLVPSKTLTKEPEVAKEEATVDEETAETAQEVAQ